MNHEADYLIIGQGLAGTCLAIELQRSGKRVQLISSHGFAASSKVAAGLMHPITGRRIVKSWLCDQLFPHAKSFYTTCERESGIRFFHAMDCIEMVTNNKSLNDWLSRTGEQELAAYIEEVPTHIDRDHLAEHVGLFRILQGGWLNIPAFLEYYRSTWEAEGLLTTTDFNESDLKENEHSIQWKKHHYDGIIFCQGYHAIRSLLWKWLPFEPSKGELLTLHIPGIPHHEILVNGIFLIPIGNDLFRVGSTYNREIIDETPSDEAKHELLEKLGHTISSNFELLDHKAGVRPAAKDRKPVLGTHPVHKRLHIFNGLGSKGSTLAPYFAQHLAGHLTAGAQLIREVDIRQYWK